MTTIWTDFWLCFCLMRYRCHFNRFKKIFKLLLVDIALEFHLVACSYICDKILRVHLNLATFFFFLFSFILFSKLHTVWFINFVSFCGYAYACIIMAVDIHLFSSCSWQKVSLNHFFFQILKILFSIIIYCYNIGLWLNSFVIHTFHELYPISMWMKNKSSYFHSN